MDLDEGREKIIIYLKKYRYIALTLIIGVLVMLTSGSDPEPLADVSTEVTGNIGFEERLGQILSQIDGVGKAQVLLTEAYGSETIFQMDSTNSESALDTVIVTDGNREEAGLVKQVLPPVYRGALVVCEGGNSASVRWKVVEAVSRVTGLSSDCITVLKMN